MYNNQLDGSIVFCTPRMLKSGLLDIKKLDDSVEIRTKYNRGKILLNDSAGFIFNTIRIGQKTVGEIIKSVADHYKVIDSDTLEQDVIESLKMLWSIGIIGWFGKNPFIERIKGQNIDCIKVTHDYSNAVLRIIKKTDYRTALVRFNGFNIPGIRYGLLRNQFIVYASVDDRDMLRSMVMLIKNEFYYDVIAIGSVNGFDHREVKSLVQFVLETLRTPLMATVLNDESVVNTFLDIGFISVGILEGESKLGTVNLLYHGGGD